MKSIVLFAAAALAVACASQEGEKVTSVPTTGATIRPNEPAPSALSRQRCAHEVMCGRVGPGKTFASRAECVRAAERDERAWIGSCPDGVDEEQMQRCADTITATHCADAIDVLDDVADCRRFELCR
jgi:hypothetical protein